MIGPIGTKFGTRLQIRVTADSSGNGHRPNSSLNTLGAFHGLGGGHKFKSGKAAKRLDRLAPNLVHVCGFIWEWT